MDNGTVEANGVNAGAPIVVEQQVAPPIAPPGQKLEEAERLAIENSYLKMQNMQLQMQNIDQAKQQLITDMRAEQAKMEAFRAKLSEKYNVDISRTTVDAEGNIRVPQKSGV